MNLSQKHKCGYLESYLPISEQVPASAATAALA